VADGSTRAVISSTGAPTMRGTFGRPQSTPAAIAYTPCYTGAGPSTDQMYGNLTTRSSLTGVSTRMDVSYVQHLATLDLVYPPPACDRRHGKRHMKLWTDHSIVHLDLLGSTAKSMI
jgi:hypothetical protein